mgnify:CR=1 FL=1
MQANLCSAHLTFLYPCCMLPWWYHYHDTQCSCTEQQECCCKQSEQQQTCSYNYMSFLTATYSVILIMRSFYNQFQHLLCLYWGAWFWHGVFLGNFISFGRELMGSQHVKLIQRFEAFGNGFRGFVAPPIASKWLQEPIQKKTRLSIYSLCCRLSKCHFSFISVSLFRK